MKIKRVTQDDIDAAAAKITRAPTRIHNCLFVTTDAINPMVLRKTGSIEIVIFDCIEYLQHFLHHSIAFERITSKLIRNWL